MDGEQDASVVALDVRGDQDGGSVPSLPGRQIFRPPIAVPSGAVHRIGEEDIQRGMLVVSQVAAATVGRDGVEQIHHDALRA